MKIEQIKNLTDKDLDRTIEFLEAQLERYELAKIYYEVLIEEKNKRKGKIKWIKKK